MSEEVSHVSIRANIPELKGKSRAEVLPFFREKIGEPTKLYDDNDWYYDTEEDFIIAIQCYDTKEWGIDWILSRGDPNECDDVNVSLDYISVVQDKMLKVFPTATGFMLCSYTWYNGVEEPITMEPNFVDED